MSTEKEKQHPRLGHRKPGGKRAMLSIRITEEDKALLKSTAKAEGVTVSDLIPALVRAYAIHNPFIELFPRPTRQAPKCPECQSQRTHVDYGSICWDEKDMPPSVREALARGETPFCCWDCQHEWEGPWNDGVTIENN